MILTVGNTEYRPMSDSGVTFTIPTATPIHPFHPVNYTGPVITETNSQHKEEFCIFRKYYVADLKHTKLGYANVTTLNLLSHICDR